MSTTKQENVKWVDGVRGFASLLVVFTHLCRGFDEDIFKPTSAEGATPRIAQLPIIRILFQGRVGVTIFSLVTGYVCALKPIRQFRAGNHEAAFTSISKSALRRIPRLFLPTTIATVIIWFICQLGAFNVAKHSDSWWIDQTSPNSSPNIWEALKQLLYHIITTWTIQWNIYDANQWTMLPLLTGSIWIFMMMIATAYVKPRYRMMVEMAFFTYFYACNDPFGMQFFYGAFLSDLSQCPGHVSWCQARQWTSRFLAPALIFLGLLLASYPEDEPQWIRWSAFMKETADWIFPADAKTARFYSGIGLQFVTLGIHFSPSAKTVLSNKYLLWFGKNSFAVYLLHGTLLRTVLVWLYYGMHVPADVMVEDKLERGILPLCGRVRFWFWLPIWFVILYSLANLWTKYIDAWCAKVTEKLVKYVFKEPSEELDAEKRLLPQ
ncbi:hypothetical protein LOCC1_G004622 [Lachnellula occidentalis]|uniref:Acyltransferase 3 domain-containing protein n=1 Tax=Lachnellula occidentalis TaxID=215460 RepID=A0A8H8RZ13_9HELO|nr:hypothetical protein LOCC1_G004622 [Lachnellula occidentalis]